jgi:hypothetical protein
MEVVINVPVSYLEGDLVGRRFGLLHAQNGLAK